MKRLYLCPLNSLLRGDILFPTASLSPHLSNQKEAEVETPRSHSPTTQNLQHYNLPFNNTKMATKIMWSFTCGHSALQFKDESGTFVTLKYNVRYNLARSEIHEACPDCRKTEHEAKVAKHEAGRKDEQALAAYQAQFKFMTEQIEAVGANTE